jgi:hypothetical protein
LLDTILQSPEPEQMLVQNLPAIDEYFLKELKAVEDEARQQGDLEKLEKIQRVMAVLEQLSENPPEVRLVEELLDVPDDVYQEDNWRKILSENPDLVTPEFLNALVAIAGQIQESGDVALAQRVMNLNRLALRFSMEREMKG